MERRERQPKRSRDDSAVAHAACWQPQYCASGKLLRKSTPLPEMPDSAIEATRSNVGPSSLRFVSAKYVPEPAIVTQQGLEQIRDKGFLSLGDCLRHIPSASTHPDVKSAMAKHSSNFEVELFLRRLQLAITKDGKVMTWGESGIRNSPAPALIRISSEQALFLFGRDRDIADVPLDHPSCSGQHAVVANLLRFDDETSIDNYSKGIEGGSVTSDDTALQERFYMITGLMDLNSTHGTFVNQKRLPPMQWHVLQASDVITFGMSTRQYVAIPPPS